MDDITPKYNLVPSRDLLEGIAFDSLQSNQQIFVPAGTLVQPKKDPLATTVGGMQVGASSMQQGNGDEIFKISPQGIHLGAANFANAPFSVDMEGNVIAQQVTFTGGTIGGFTITATSLYGGIIKTASNVGVGHTGVIMDTAGLRGYDSVLGLTFNLPTSGAAPTFSSGIINSTIFNINTSAVLRTSSTVGDGTANSAGILINNTGIYGCETNQLLAAANVRILVDGSAFFSGTFDLGSTLITVSDITLLQAAIDEASAAGGGIVSLAPNTYNATTSFTIPSFVTLNGNGATIDFGAAARQILIQGTSAYSTGTLAVNFASGSVTGTGTTWTAGMIGQSILIGDFWYTITARASNTAITISPVFRAPNVSGATYVIATTIESVVVQNLVLQNASGTLFKFRYCNGITMDGLVATSAGQGVDGDDSGTVNYVNSQTDTCTVGNTFDNIRFGTFNGFNIFDISGGTAFALNGVSNTSIGSFDIQRITGVGLSFTNCFNIGAINYAIIETSSHCVEFVSGNSEVDLISAYYDTSGGDVIKLTATTDNCHLIAQTMKNYTGYGVNIAASTCDNNVILAPSFGGGGSGTINDSGTGTVIFPQTLSTFVVQDVPISAGTGTPEAIIKMTSDTTGTVLFLCVCASASSQFTLYRLVKDTVTSNYRITNSVVNATISANGLKGIAVAGNYIYIFCTVAAAAAVRRYDKADLANLTSMTGTIGTIGTAWSDGTDLYTLSSASNFDKYTISGTTLTNAATVGFTTASSPDTAICNGTNVYLGSLSSGTYSILKYPKAGGASTSTTTITYTQSAWPNASNSSLFIASATILGFGFEFNYTNATAVTGLFLHLSAISLP